VDVLVSIERSIVLATMIFILKAGLTNLAKNINNGALTLPQVGFKLSLGYRARGTHEKYEPNILKSSKIRKNINKAVT
jgi:hypothetical protein